MVRVRDDVDIRVGAVDLPAGREDGNGRVGRLIAFKECLKNNIVPFIILDSKKMFYYRGLKNWNQERGWLIDTCLDGQDTVKAYLDYFKIEY